jgi:uncharacterized protein
MLSSPQPLPRPRRRTLRRFLLAIGLALLAGFGALNVLAYRHARAMLRYSADGARTERPEDLSRAARLRLLWVGVNLPRPATDLPPTALAPHAHALAIDVPGGVALCAWHADCGPDAPLVIFFHGYSTEKSRLLREARKLHDHGASVLLVDFRGSGGSSESYATLGWLEAQDVAAAVEFARDRLPHSRIVLYGQSMGSVAILRAIHAHAVRPDAVVLESVFDTLLNAIRARFRAMRVPAFPSAELMAFWGGRQFGFNGFAHDPILYARSLPCPALFLHGDDDPRAPLPGARRVFAAAPGARNAFVSFPGVGHGSYAAAHPDAWLACVLPFVLPQPVPSSHAHARPARVSCLTNGRPPPYDALSALNIRF